MRRILILIAVCTFSASGSAQAPRGSDTLSPGAINDSLKILQDLDAKVRANKQDAAAWSRRGLVAWSLAERARVGNAPKTLDETRLGRLADTSLRIAAQIDSKNPYYRMAVGRFLIWSGVPTARFAAGGFFEAALDAARKTDDPNVHAESAIEFGRVAWRRYDALSNRRIETTPGSAVRSIRTALNPSSPGVDAVQQPLKAVREIIESGSMALPADLNGAHYYEEASKLFREAYDAAPTNARTFRHVAMTIADKNRWTELEEFARKHTASVPWDPIGWMALGLALQREGRSVPSAAAFDSAMSVIDPHERTRLDRLERVLPSGDSARQAKRTPAEQAAYGRLYWLLADPLWGQPGNESRVEYFARVTFAELRWTVDELNVRGADTDRGDIYIRYGPPDIVASFGPAVSDGNVDAMAVSTTWIYQSGLAFVFQGQATFATAHTARSDVDIVQAMTQMQPIRWDNVAAPKIDSMPAQVVRFRGGKDSVDVFLASDPPVDSIRAAMASGVVPIHADAWLVGASSYHDSTGVESGGVKTFSRRVAPGSYLYRLEASAPAVHRGARSSGVLDASDNPATGIPMH
ncbi:MAG TPA: GWxTD domain-containing protein, partial [Gemmatimonadaceae bacterium]|nr:GWxTD domain-containing protein [Gemmatimonadaceae bacterium]